VRIHIKAAEIGIDHLLSGSNGYRFRRNPKGTKNARIRIISNGPLRCFSHGKDRRSGIEFSEQVVVIVGNTYQWRTLLEAVLYLCFCASSTISSKDGCTVWSQGFHSVSDTRISTTTQRSMDNVCGSLADMDERNPGKTAAGALPFLCLLAHLKHSSEQPGVRSSDASQVAHPSDCEDKVGWARVRVLPSLQEFRY
jgi:hypothetical protein